MSLASPPATAGKRAYAPRLPPEQRREQLLDVALAIVLEGGFHAVTVDGVARAAGVTRPVVYGAFADRSALLGALLDRSEHRAMTALAPALPDVPSAPEDPVELLVRGVTAYLTAVHDDPPTWRVLLVPPEGAPPELQQRLDSHHRAILRHLRSLVVWGLEAMERPDLDADLFARSVMTLSEGAARLLLTDPERFPVERHTAFTRAVLRTLAGDPA